LFATDISITKEFNTFANLNFDMIKYRLFILIFLFIVSVQAQLLNEIGFFGGGANYSGDIGDETYIKPNTLAGSLIYRRNLNTRLTLRSTLSLYPIADDDANSSNPVRQDRGYSFNNTLIEFSAGVEINYLDYDITTYEFAYTPYLIFEAAAYHYNVVSSVAPDGTYNYASEIGYALPIGIGFKQRITRNFGYSVELRARYSLADNLDFSDENIPQLNFGNPDHGDWYFFSGIGLTYSFGRPPCAVPPRY
jgi:hypothetical protein